MARRRLVSPAPAVGLSLLLLLVACQPSLEAEAPAAGDVDAREVAAPEAVQPSGGVARVGVPAQPAGGLPVDDLDVAGGDLLALWGLPLYRVDAQGLLRPALVDTAEVSADGREVRLRLRRGAWSDGRPVTADDVHATVAAVRDDPDRPDDLGWLADVEVVDERTAVLHLDHPTRRWPLTLAATGVLPAHVVEDTDLGDWGEPPPVVGGPFRPVEVEPGLRTVLEAHPEGPLGPPALDGLEVVVVPSFDTALGLLAEDRLDAIVGHLAIRPELRPGLLDEQEGVTAAGSLAVAAPLGGTEVSLRFTPDGALGADPAPRLAVGEVVDVRHQVEGLGLGRPVPAPAGAGDAPEGDAAAVADLDVAMVVSSEQEALVATGRLLEAQVRGEEGTLRIEAEPTPHDVRRADDLDIALVVRRRPAAHDLRPSLPDEDLGLVAAADAMPTDRDEAAGAAWDRAAELAWEVPLYRARVAHVWHERLEGMEPSAWAGAGLASASRWRLTGD